MATIRLTASAYATSGSSYIRVADASNMYTDTDSTTYATITNIEAATTSRYLYLRGFNFSAIPEGSTINSFEVKIKGYESGLSTSTTYAPRLSNNTSNISNAVATTSFGTTSKIITIPTGSLTWQNIVNYGSTFSIKVTVRRSNKNNTGYFYCQGAEIVVDYTPPAVASKFRIKSNGSWVTPSKILVKQGGSWVEPSKILVKDGGTWK